MADYEIPDFEVDVATGKLKSIDLHQNTVVQTGLNRKLLYTKPEVDSQIAITAATKANIAQLPRPLGSRLIGLGDSIMAGLTPSGQYGSAGPFTDSRPNYNAWFNRMCFKNPNKYYRLRNTGTGGDITGGYGVITSVVTAGSSTSAIFRVTRGNPIYAGTPFYFGALAGTSEAKTAATSTNNNDGTYTVTWSGGTTNTWPVGSPILWGMLGRLSYDVTRWSPEICLIMAGTNDLNNITPTQIVSALMDMATDLRAANIEPIFLELLPRSNYMDLVVQTNDLLRYSCRTFTGGTLHCIPVYATFAGSDGKYASSSYTDDGLHPSPLGNKMLANLVDGYLTNLPLRISKVPLAAYDTDPTNLLTNTHFLTSSAGGGGQIPTGWTYNPFFAVNIVPSVATPGTTDGINGNWFKLTSTAGTGTASLRQSLSSAPAVGDILRLTARIRTTGFSGSIKASVQYLDGSFNNDLIYQLTEDGADDVLINTCAAVTSTAANTFQVLIDPNGGSGTVWLAQPFVQNLTALGRAS